MTKISAERVAKAVEEQLTPGEGRVQLPRFNFNGLASQPRQVDRNWLKLLGQLTVIPGTCVVLTGRNGFQQVYNPGTYNLFDVPLGPALVQVVDTTTRTQRIPPVTALSRDKWNVTLRLAVAFRVDDPKKIVRRAEPLKVLEETAISCTLAQVESMLHDELTGRPEDGGVDEVARGILERLRKSPSVEGLVIEDVVILERVGDERRVEIMQEATVEETRIAEESRLQIKRDKARLRDLAGHREIAERQQEIAILEAETERLRAEEEEKLKLARSRLEATVAQIEQEQARWQAELERQREERERAREREVLELKAQHEEAMEVIKGLSAITIEAAKSGQLENLGISRRRRPELAIVEGQESVVGQGLQALRALKDGVESLSPPAFEGENGYRRVQEEEERLKELEGVEYQLTVRQSRIAEANVVSGEKTLIVQCPPEYPNVAPTVTLIDSQGQERSLDLQWEEDFYLSDLISQALPVEGEKD